MTPDLINRFQRWRRYRTTVRELQNLTSRELQDLGLSRGDIHRVARQASAF
jgi:uncharacterized protein YjiS (DUF1127 family)